jgi:hypothetical protein
LLKKLLLLAVVAVVAAYGVLDVAARRLAEGKIAERAEAAVGGRASATANVDSFPFVLRLLTSGSAGDISLRVTEVGTSVVDFAFVEAELRSVELDRGKLLGERKAEVTAIDSGTLTLGIDAAAVGKALRGLPVTITGGRVEVRVAGAVRVAEVSLAAGGALRIGVPQGPSVTIPVPRTPLGTCQPSALKVEGGVVELSCTLREVPPALLRAVQQ